MTDPDPSRRPRNVSEVKRALMPYASPLLYQYLFCYLLGFCLFSCTITQFDYMLLLMPYMLLAPALLVGSGIIGWLRARRTIAVRPSLKANMLIIGRQILLSLRAVFLVTGWIALLYALLVRPPLATADQLFLLFYTGFFILATLISFFAMLKKRRDMSRPGQATGVRQVLPMQQQGQK